MKVVKELLMLVILVLGLLVNGLAMYTMAIGTIESEVVFNLAIGCILMVWIISMICTSIGKIRRMWGQ